MAERKPFLLRIDADVLDALQRWANDDLRSLNGQIEFLLRKVLKSEGRLSDASLSARRTNRSRRRAVETNSGEDTPKNDRAETDREEQDRKSHEGVEPNQAERNGTEEDRAQNDSQEPRSLAPNQPSAHAPPKN